MSTATSTAAAERRAALTRSARLASDRALRIQALQYAMEQASRVHRAGGATGIVADAEKFYQFLLAPVQASAEVKTYTPPEAGINPRYQFPESALRDLLEWVVTHPQTQLTIGWAPESADISAAVYNREGRRHGVTAPTANEALTELALRIGRENFS